MSCDFFFFVIATFELQYFLSFQMTKFKCYYFSLYPKEFELLKNSSVFTNHKWKLILEKIGSDELLEAIFYFKIFCDFFP